MPTDLSNYLEELHEISLSNFENGIAPTIGSYEDPLFKEYDKPTDIDKDWTLWSEIGSGLWAFLDEAGFGVPGIVAGEEWEEKMHAQTVGGSLLAGIGSLAGFVLGAPMKLGGKPAVKLFASQSVSKLVKEGGEKFV